MSLFFHRLEHWMAGNQRGPIGGFGLGHRFSLRIGRNSRNREFYRRAIVHANRSSCVLHNTPVQRYNAILKPERTGSPEFFTGTREVKIRANDADHRVAAKCFS